MSTLAAPLKGQATSNSLPELIPTDKPIRIAREGRDPQILTDIYRNDTNIAIWQRQLNDELTLAIDEILKSNARLAITEVVTAESTRSKLYQALGKTNAVITISNDISLLVDMFCCLFDIKQAGLRLSALDSAMCPRFHFDRIPCRMVSTYQGIATEWLPHNYVNHNKLGANNQGKSDDVSGLFQSTDDIRQLNNGDVALLKGEYWHNNEGGGLVHRSPSVSIGERRLLLTLDFIND
mgnify:FL=1